MPSNVFIMLNLIKCNIKPCLITHFLLLANAKGNIHLDEIRLKWILCLDPLYKPSNQSNYDNNFNNFVDTEDNDTKSDVNP